MTSRRILFSVRQPVREFPAGVTVHTLLIRYSKIDEIKKTFFLLEKAIC